MKRLFKVFLIVLCCALGLSGIKVAAAKSYPLVPGSKTKIDAMMPQSAKGLTAIPGPFQVKEVRFDTVVIDNQTHLVAAVVFNQDIDASSVKENVNIRMLKNENNFWVDASTHNNTVRIRPNFITWVSGAPLETGVYKMYLRGTIKSTDGKFLDCDKDGVGEGGNLPAYESQLYQGNVIELQEMDNPPTGMGNMFDNI